MEETREAVGDGKLTILFERRVQMRGGIGAVRQKSRRGFVEGGDRGGICGGDRNSATIVKHRGLGYPVRVVASDLLGLFARGREWLHHSQKLIR